MAILAAWLAPLVALAAAPVTAEGPARSALDSLPPLGAINKKDFCVYQSALSPFIVIRNEGPRTLLFQNLLPTPTRHGYLGPPTRVALVDDHKVRVLPTTRPIDPQNMSESWLVFWHAGAKGWDDYDVPMLVVLQKLPTSIRPSGGGIELTFAAESGCIAIAPLYGMVPRRAAEVAQWNDALPDAIAQRCRLLAEISRQIPIQVQERFKLLPQQDKVIIRDRFEFMSIDDDWKTPHRKIAPLEYTIARAWKNGFRLLSVSGKVVDLEMPVRQGFFAGIEGDECSYTLTALLKYVNQAEQAKAIPSDHPLLAEARRNFDWGKAAWTAESPAAAMDKAAEVAAVLPYADPQRQAELRKAILARTTDAMRSGAQSSSIQFIESAYRVAAAINDFKTVQENWPSLRRIYGEAIGRYGWGPFDASLEGPDASTILGASAAFARLAWRVGDDDAYRFACYKAAKQFVWAWNCEATTREWKELWEALAQFGMIRKTRPSLAELRFMKERMADAAKAWFAKDEYGKNWTAEREFVSGVPAAQHEQNLLNYWSDRGLVKGHEFMIILAGIDPKYAPLWQGGARPPKPDDIFRVGVGESIGAPAFPAAVWISPGLGADDWPMLCWPGADGPWCLCGVGTGDDQPRRSFMKIENFGLTVEAFDYLKK